ncbi:hypothetical protein [Longimicrobium terrae]|uniref:DUF4345 domain-containing protein n=1 Tax=Longimicrobium terrae TaxID=1639882 RepID=A0A841GKV2_9BACT|nr:hypothetical protein [Longimicrobium terrae]MBB4634832.1 hypothetical protein [Longimicrobium terrae]MBB6069227.1 hypothetical protein [Longimicrobium terrae]
MSARDGASAAGALAVTQGAFYLATGLWPIVHLPSFEAVTGEKTDKWLVKTVGALIAAGGAAMMMAGLRRRVTPEIALLAAGSAAALTAVDVNYTARRVIPPVYLLDAAAESALIAGWAVLAARSPLFDDADERPGANSGRDRSPR